jgi:two-component system response regulator
METTKPISILMAEDDIEDQMLVREAFMEARLANDLAIVSDGEQLLDYLHKRGEYTECTRPHIILLDLNMPRKNGREALAEIKSDPLLKQIPIIVLTSSSADEDIVAAYDLGVSSYILKPVTFENLVDLVKELGHYWLEIVELPPDI